MHASEASVPVPAPESRKFLGHPRLLWRLLAVTVWFNFAFYGFRAFLAPYIAGAFFANLPQADALKQADLLFAGFGTLLYAVTILGGWVADNVLGEVRAVRLSFWLMVPATAAMAWPGREGFTLALAFWVLAAGLNIPLTVLIGRNYAKEDPKRDAGYTLYYLAINLGGFIAPFICATWVGAHYGYRWGFVAAAVGMLLCAILFEWRHRRMPGAAERVRFRFRGDVPVVTVVLLALMYPTALLLAHPEVLHVAVRVLMGMLVLYFIVSSVRRGDRVQGRRYIAMLILFVALVAFWAWSLQGATSLNFFARDYVRMPFHLDFTAFQSANSLYILIFAPVLALLWPWLDKLRINPSTPRKFGIGILLVAFSYGVMVYAIHHLQGADGRTPWWPLALCYLFSTLGELALSPIGYALIGKLAAPDEASLAMGGWFFGVGVSYDLSGQIAAMTTSGAHTGIAGYAHVYSWLLWSGIGIAVVYLIAAPWIVKLMHGVR